jgi:hypothetical protein
MAEFARVRHDVQRVNGWWLYQKRNGRIRDASGQALAYDVYFRGTRPVEK